MSSVRLDRCGNCRFMEVTYPGNHALIECRRHAPIAFAYREPACGEIITKVWPRVSTFDSCGDFEAKNGEKTSTNIPRPSLGVPLIDNEEI